MKVSWRTEVFSWSVITAMFAAAAWAWGRVPERIPVHWNAAGEVDGYGGRFMGLLLIPLMTLGMHLLFMVLPAIDPCRASYDGFARVYAIFRSASGRCVPTGSWACARPGPCRAGSPGQKRISWRAGCSWPAEPSRSSAGSPGRPGAYS